MAAIAPPANSNILIYAELLTNIRQVTVKVSLPTPADHTTVAEVCDEGRKFRISHDGDTCELALPATVPVKGTLPISHKGSVDPTWRLPLQPVRAPERQFLPENQPLPWSASDVKPGSPVSCRACGQNFLQNETITIWKDLPSENWAEMMEFWHCHKPVDHHQQEEGGLQQRGYGAASAITAQPGVGFVDITSFLFAESDCSSIKVSRHHIHINGEIEGGQVRATASQCHGHRYNSPKSTHCPFRLCNAFSEYPPHGWVSMRRFWLGSLFCTRLFRVADCLGHILRHIACDVATAKHNKLTPTVFFLKII